ncbi:MAG: alpha/beta hydrolase [Chloroflexota bacterium]|nr:alpha/beta hydrolase [Chloroflexota bacterium]
MRRSTRFCGSVTLLFSLVLSLLGVGTQGFVATAADSGAAPRFEPSACVWKLPDGQIEGQTVKCGFAVVPEQRRNPTGPTIKLPVAVFKSASANPAPDPLVYIEGGPGGAVSDTLTYLLSGDLPVLTANRDLIVYDQRGVGFAQPNLGCPEVTASDLADAQAQLSPDDKASHDIAAIAVCRDRLTKQGINLGAYTSAEGAADLNDIRAVLGYAKLDLLGVSYGTRVALTMMRDFPDAVRGAVLDSSVPLQANLVEDDGANFDRSFRLFFAACAADVTCNAKNPTLQADYVATVAQLNAQPITTPVKDNKSGVTVPVVVDGYSFTSVVAQMFYDKTATSLIPRLIAQVQRGDTMILNLLIEALGITGPDINVGTYYSILCSEEVPFNSRERATALAGTLPPELQAIFLANARQYFDVCAQWPVSPVNPVETQPVASNVPALVLSSDNDPATPPDYGKQVAGTLAKGYLVTFPGIGHSILGNGGDCGLKVMTTFINDPTTPPATDCVPK